MYKALHIWRLALLSVLFLLGGTVQASHIWGGEITYRPLGNNQYLVVATIHQDCGSTMFYPTLTLHYQVAGCGGPSSSAAMPQVGSTQPGSPYCPTASGGSSPCGAGLPTNYYSTTYQTTVALPPGHWVLSITESARAETSNTLGQTLIYLESVLDNTSGIANTAAVSTLAPMQLVSWKQLTRFSALAFDADGDSLVYSLAAPLQGCNNPLTYKPVGTSPFIDLSSQNNGNPCVGVLPANGMYSPTFPIASYTFTGTCPVVNAVPAFGFSAQMGEMVFTPYLFALGLMPNANRYIIAVKVDEYRRQTTGAYTFVGSTQREIMMIVVDTGNHNPTLNTLSVNGTTQPLTSTIATTAGQPLSLQLTSADADAGQLVELTSNASQLLPGASFAVTGNGTATLTWMPPVGLRPGLYYCTIISTDNACPIKGIEHRTLTFRVSASALATQAAKTVTTLAAVPTPFTGEVSFQLARPGVQTVVVFDQLGRWVTELRSQPSGKVVWQPAATVPAGLYLARTPDGRQVARLLRTGNE